jgi:hypothetical protein
LDIGWKRIAYDLSPKPLAWLKITVAVRSF